MTGLRLPTGRTGRFAALGLTVLALGAIWFGVVSPLICWHADRGVWLIQQQALEARMAGLVATLPDLRRRAGAGRAEAKMPGEVLLQGNSDATAGAALQQRVQDMAAKAGVDLVSVETLPALPAGALRRVALHLTATSPWAPLVHLLASIQQADPSMMIDDLQLHGTMNLARPLDSPISASFSIIGFRAGAGG